MTPTPSTVRLRVASEGVPVAAPGVSSQQLEVVLDRARQLGVPLHQDPQVAGILASLRLDAQVPPALYAAAASVLACVYAATAQPPPPAAPESPADSRP